MVTTVIKQALSNKVVQFIFSGYFTYFIQFINSLFIAVYLGPYYLGIWGFLNLLVQYFAQINLGIPHSVNAIASVKKNDTEYVTGVFNTAFIMLCVLCLLAFIIILFNNFFDFGIGEKYHFQKYSYYIGLIVVLNYFIALFTIIFRIYGKLFEIAFSQSIFPIMMLGCLFFFRGEDLLVNLVRVYWLSIIASVALFYIRSPIKVNFQLDFTLAKKIQFRGWFLFLYNSSFYLIVISTRSFISSFYSVSDFGYFTFAFSLGNVILLLFQSFASLIFPKLLNKLAKSDNSENITFLKRVRNDYIGLSHLLVHSVVLAFPLFLYFFPKFQNTLESFRIIALTLVLYTNTFGYQGLLIARGKEKLLAKVAMISLVLNLALAYIICLWKFPFQFVTLSTLVTYLFFTIIIGVIGQKELSIDTKGLEFLNGIFPLTMLAPFFTSLLLVLLNSANISYILPLLMFLLMNINKIKSTSKTIRQVIKNPDIINI